MARLCARCRQPVDRDARDHDCPVDDPPAPEDAGEALEQWPGWGPLVPGDEGDAA